jgi:CRP-like cAMP-binding protein
MNTQHLAKNQVAFKDRSDLLLSKESKFPDFREKNIPYLSNIPENALANLIRKTKTLRYTRKETIDSASNNTNSLVIIFTGNMKVFSRYDKAGKETVVQVQEPNAGIAKLALITDELRSNSAITLEQTLFAVVLKSDFISWLMHYPSVEFALLNVKREKLAS